MSCIWKSHNVFYWWVGKGGVLDHHFEIKTRRDVWRSAALERVELSMYRSTQRGNICMHIWYKWHNFGLIASQSRSQCVCTSMWLCPQLNWLSPDMSKSPHRLNSLQMKKWKKPIGYGVFSRAQEESKHGHGVWRHLGGGAGLGRRRPSDEVEIEDGDRPSDETKGPWEIKINK